MTDTQKKNVHVGIFIALLSAVVLSGCHSGSCPRLRNSDFFGAPNGIRFPDPDNLGTHSLKVSPNEKLGFVYTCKGGFIDLGHLREAADRTYYAAGVVYETLILSKNDCSFKIIEPSQYYLAISYPDHWQNLSAQEQQSIARDISVQYGQYLGHLSLIWHEILTWYGYSSSGLFSEYISSFSCEDPYSDALGTYLGAKALLRPKEPYEKVMTSLIDEMLQKLDVQPANVAKEALKKVKGQWYEGGGYFFVTMKKRNFDVGYGDGFVTPWLVPDICPEMVTQDCPVPNPSAILDKHGFKMRIEMQVMANEKDQIYKALNLKSTERISPPLHFQQIINSIIDEAKKLQGDDVGKNTWTQTETKRNS